MSVETVKMQYTTSSGTPVRVSATLEKRDGRIYFWDGQPGTKTKFELSREIKAMRGAHYHGYDEEGPYAKKKVWSVDDCQRNRMQIGYLCGEDVYAWFDRPLQRHEYRKLTRGGVPAILMPHQADMSDAGLTYHYQIFGAEMGTGKGGLPSTKVATPTGWTTLGEIKVGDTVINPSGGTTRVRGVYPRGRMAMYRVTFSDGASTVCSADHLWCVRTAVQKWRGQDYAVQTLQEIVDSGLCYVNGNAKHYIPMVEPVQYAGRDLPVPPYLAGYILGNGGLTGYVNIVSIPDQETVKRLNSLMSTPPVQKKDSEYDYRITDEAVNRWIDDTGLRGCGSAEKHVADDYLFASVYDRVSLLQGLCDSNGYACKSGGVEYATTSSRLRDVFVTLVQSLGGTCAVAEKFPEYTYSGERRVGQLAYRINAAFPAGVVPFRLNRKVQAYVVPSKYQPTRAIVDVTPTGDDECICIAVESDGQQYVTDDFIVTHNTLSAQMVIEKSGVNLVWWAGPKTSIPNIKREFKLWGFPSHIQVEFFTYEGLVRVMDEWDGSQTLPQFFVADESSRCKNDTSQRSKAVQKLADLIREKYGHDGYVIEMSGTPSPKTPCDWWSQCLSADTWVLTESGPRQICQLIGTPVQLRVRDKSCATDGFYCTGERQLFRLDTEEGYVIKATADHRFFRVDDGWCKLSDLYPGDRIALANSGDTAWSGVGTFGDGYLLGFLVGDGTLYYKDDGLHARLPVYGRKRSLIPTLLAYLPTPYEPTGTEPVSIQHRYVSGLARQFGFTPEKAIPADFERLASSDCVRGFLRGLFDTDGSVDRNRLRVTVSQACRARLLVVQRFLSYFGIHSTLQFKRRVAAKCSHINGRQIASAEVMYVLHVTGDDAVAFHARIGFLHPDKARTLASRLAARHRHNPRRWATVRTVAMAGVESTYDAEVPSEHCFAANGLLAHNCEIAWPGFLKEGSRRAMEERLAFMVEQEFDAGKFKKRIGWKDNENKCAKCGATREEGPHDECADPDEYHPFEASKNEVAYLYERLKGLVVVKHKKDCLNLPEKRYRKIICKPTASILRVAESIVRNEAINAVTGMTLLRELSDGFQYREVQDGMMACTHCTDGTVAEWMDPENPEDRYQAIDLLDPDLQARLVKETVSCPLCDGKREVPKYVRITREVPCPKDAALKMLLDENEEVGRLVVFAGFTGSVDHIVKLCLKEKWDVVRCDQGNFQVFAAKSDSPDGVVVTDEEPLDYWADLEKHGKVVFVANPESGGMSLTLVEARMAVYWSNSWKPEYRVQSEDRIHRKGMDENLGCTIVDLIHLPSDDRVLRVIRANRKLELMTLGEILDGVDWKDASEDGEMQVEEVAS